jgi:hypothetical protein
MTTAIEIAVDGYLKTSDRPDCRQVDGEVRERNLGEYHHSQPLAIFLLVSIQLEERLADSGRSLDSGCK